MEYELLAIGKADELVGHVIRKVGLPKLHSINIYTPSEYDEAIKDLMKLNIKASLHKFWPDPGDPEVQVLIANPDFDPVEYDEVDTPDLKQSKIIYDTKPGAQIGRDPEGNPIFGPDEVKYDDRGEPIINWMASEVVYKKERHPKRTDGRSRIEKACEQVAHARMVEHQRVDNESSTR